MAKVLVPVVLFFVSVFVSAVDLGTLGVPSGGPKSFGPSQAFTAPPEMKAGQWFEMRNLVNDRVTSVSKVAFLDLTSDVWTIEVVNIDSGGTTVTQAKIQSFFDKPAPDKGGETKVLSIKMKDKNGKVTVVSDAMLAMMGSGMQNLFPSRKKFDHTLAAGGPVTVPAGTFASTFVSKTERKIGDKTIVSTAWIHSAVPGGAVKTVTDLGDGSSRVTELVDFGASGYVSQF